MKKVFKVILICEVIILFLFFLGYIVYDNLYFELPDDYGFQQIIIAPVNDSCFNVTFELVVNQSE